MYVDLIIIVASTAILLLGGSITYYALRAYARTDDPALRGLGVGFGIVTFGAMVGGIAHLTIGDLAVGIAVNSTLMAIGFGFIVYSLFLD